MVLPQGAAALAPLLVVEHLNHGEVVEEDEGEPSPQSS